MQHALNEERRAPNIFYRGKEIFQDWPPEEGEFKDELSIHVLIIVTTEMCVEGVFKGWREKDINYLEEAEE